MNKTVTKKQHQFKLGMSPKKVGYNYNTKMNQNSNQSHTFKNNDNKTIYIMNMWHYYKNAVVLQWPCIE